MTIVGGTQHGLATMRAGEKKSHERLLWRRTSSGNPELNREKSKFRINDEDGRRNSKGIEGPSEDSMLWKASGCHGEGIKERPGIRNPEDDKRSLLKFQDVVLQVKETQTRARREEKGLQISMGRHASRASAVLAQSGAQTDIPPLYSQLKEKVRIYRAPIMFYLTAVIVSFASVYASLVLVNTIKGPVKAVIPPPGPGFFCKLGNVFSSFMHNCSHCPTHR